MVQNKITEKIRIITPEQFHAETMKVIRQSLLSLLFKYQISYKIEQDPGMKKKRLAAWEQCRKELAQIESVLSIAEKEEIEAVYVKTKDRIYDCSLIKPQELGEDSLSNLLIELSETMKP